MIRNSLARGCNMCLALTLALAGARAGSAQEDELHRWLRLPPQSLQHDEQEQMLKMLEWERLKSDRLSSELHMRRESLQQELQQLNDRISTMESQIPRQLSFIDQETRSQLVGDCLEQLLDAQLELAATEAMIDAVQSSAADRPADETRIAILKTKLQAAASMLEMAQTKLARAKEMRDGGYLSAEELAQAQMAQQNAAADLQILELELQAAERDKSRPPADSRLGELQITSAALRAKIGAANRFLEEVGASSDIERELRALRNKRSQLETSIDLSTRVVEENALKGTQLDSVLGALKWLEEQRSRNTPSNDEKPAVEVDEKR